MTSSHGLVDLHCHLLPGLDDGPQTVQEAAELGSALQELGFEQIFPTPHQKQGSWTPDPQRCDAARSELQQALEDAGCTLQIHPAAGENMWDGLFLERLEQLSFPHYPGERAFLLEFQEPTPPQLLDQLFRFRLDGRLPVIAHVERYPSLLAKRDLLLRLGQSAAVLVNLSTLGGALGFWNRRTARRLVRQGLVHAVATDSHGLADVKPCLAGLSWIRSTLGQPTVHALLRDGPLRILDGDLPES